MSMKLTIAAVLLIVASAANAASSAHVIAVGPVAYLHRQQNLGDAQSTSVGVKNDSDKPIHVLDVECGFYAGDKLVGAGSNFALDVGAGQTAYLTVDDRAGVLGGGITQRVDRAECRAFEQGAVKRKQQGGLTMGTVVKLREERKHVSDLPRRQPLNNDTDITVLLAVMPGSHRSPAT